MTARHVAGVILACAVGACGPATGQDADALAQLAQDIAARMQAVQTIEAEGERAAAIEVDGETRSSLYPWSFVFQAPNKLRLRRFGLDVTADGENLYSRAARRSASTPDFAPEYVKVQIEGSLLDTLNRVLPAGDYMTPDIRALLSGDPDTVVSGLVGEHPVEAAADAELDGRPCWRIDASVPGIVPEMDTPINIWIDKGSGLVSQWLVDAEEANRMLAAGEGPPRPRGAEPLEIIELGERATVFTVNEPIEEDVFRFTQTKAPDFEMELLNGETFKLSRDGEGKVVFLDFWATWCPPCLAAMPHLAELAKEMAGEEIVFLGISVDQPEAHGRVPEVFESTGAEYPCGIDTEELDEEYGVVSLPCMVIIDREGRLVGRFSGFHPRLSPRLIEETLEKVLAGEDIGMTEPEE